MSYTKKVPQKLSLFVLRVYLRGGLVQSIDVILWELDLYLVILVSEMCGEYIIIRDCLVSRFLHLLVGKVYTIYAAICRLG